MIHFFEPEINLYIWYFLVLSGAVLCIVALLFLIRNDKREGHSSLLSALLILFVPIIGPLFYLVRFYKNKKLLALLFLAVSTQLFGNGVTSSYMGIPFFVPTMPINYDSAEFVLLKTNLD